ncbi:unnamed protein product [Amoebophrya sp. A120]|nr:unnamed protein product [Amoebophrya sp. A120]|eukprot:GSA120T00021370001.1
MPMLPTDQAEVTQPAAAELPRAADVTKDSKEMSVSSSEPTPAQIVEGNKIDLSTGAPTSDPDVSTQQKQQQSFILQVKWKKEVYDIEIGHDLHVYMVEELKHELFSLTEILPHRQKLVYKGKTIKEEELEPAASLQSGPRKKPLSLAVYFLSLVPKEEMKTDGTPGGETAAGAKILNPSSPVMLLGSPETEINAMMDVFNDLASSTDTLDDFEDDDFDDEANNNYSSSTVFQPVLSETDDAKIAKRVARGKDYIEIVNPPRPGKKLLMLDIDYTFFDHRTPAESALQLRRPYLMEFLTAVYPHYDIGIWSATGKQWIDLKLQQLEILAAPATAFNLCIVLDARAMISTWSAKKQTVVKVKPLEVIWRYAKQMNYGANFNPENTIMFDDLGRNFLLNPQQGLKIRPFKNALTDGRTDTELLKLKDYLLKIKDLPSFKFLNHKKWEKYLKNGDGGLAHEQKRQKK